MTKIVYLDAFPAANAHDILNESPNLEVVRITSDMPEDEAFALLADAHAYQQFPTRDEVPAALRPGADLLKRCPNLLIVSSNGSGVDTVDVEACTAAGVLVVNQAGGNAEAVAEHSMAMILSLLKRIGESDHKLRRGWKGVRTDLLGRNLEGRTVGIVGIGFIGKRMAAITRDVFGCRVLAYDPYVSADEIAARKAEPVGLDELLRQAEILTIHCPLTAETKGMIGAQEIARMPEGALLISTARGGIVDEAALADALSSGKDRRRRPRRLGSRAAAIRPSATRLRYGDREPAHGWRHRRQPSHHGALRRDPAHRPVRRPPAGPARQSRGVRALPQALRGDPRARAGAVLGAIRSPGEAAAEILEHGRGEKSGLDQVAVPETARFADQAVEPFQA